MSSPEPSQRQDLARRRAAEHLASFVAGGLAAPLVTAPLDVLRTRLQASDGVILDSRTQTLRGLAAQLRGEVARKGVSPLFAGLAPALVGSVLQFATLMGCYGTFRDAARSAWPELPRGLKDVAAGGLAGAAASIVSNPAYVLKTRMQTLTAAEACGQSGTVALARRLVHAEGGIALMRGTGPSLLLVSFNALQLPIYHELRALQLPTFAAVAGSVAVANAATYPLQVVRTRFQAQRSPCGTARMYASLFDVFKHAWTQEHGLRSLYAGFTPHLARSCVSWYIKFSTAERVAAMMSAK